MQNIKGSAKHHQIPQRANALLTNIRTGIVVGLLGVRFKRWSSPQKNEKMRDENEVRANKGIDNDPIFPERGWK